MNNILIKANNRIKELKFQVLPNTQKAGRLNPSFPTFPPPPPPFPSKEYAMNIVS